jgi:hypothetical protein
MPATCPTCLHEFDLGSADCGSVLACPLCEGHVAVRRPREYAVAVKPVRPQERWLRQILLVFGTIALVVFAICGGAGYALYDHVAEPDFVPYASAEGRFRLEFPGKPYRANPLGIEAVILERSVPDEAYMILWVDLPEERMAAGAEAILDETCAGASQFNAAVAEEISRGPIRCGRWPGREMVFHVRGEQGKGMMRAVLARSRMYLLFAGGSFIQTDTARAKQFFESLSID